MEFLCKCEEILQLHSCLDSKMCSLVNFSLMVCFVDQEEELTPEASRACYPNISLENDAEYPEWLAGESQGLDDVELRYLEDNLLCNEVLDSSAFISNSQQNQMSFPLSSGNGCHDFANGNVPCGIADLENLEFDTPPDFHLAVSLTSHFPKFQMLFFDQ